jgi:hypothetical protein
MNIARKLKGLSELVNKRRVDIKSFEYSKLVAVLVEAMKKTTTDYNIINKKRIVKSDIEY